MTFGKKRAGRQPQTKLQKRIAGISTPDLVATAETALFVIGRDLYHGVQTLDADRVAEAALQAEQLSAITAELQRRIDATL
jgi:hypothetical protein